jgi:hypothetical protein
MTVKKITENLAVCQRDIPEVTKFKTEVYTAICMIENLDICPATTSKI